MNLLDQVAWPADTERLMAILLDDELRPIRTAWLADGDRDGVELDPRRVLTAALAEDASAIILAHNHPSGSRIISAADRHVTGEIFRTLKAVRVKLLDHLILAAGGWLSMRAEGYL